MAPKAARKARSRRSRGDNGAATQETTTDMDAHSTGAATTATSVDGDGPRVPGVSRERALFFATGQRAAAPTSPRGAPEAWPGYFQTARDLSENRLAAQAARVEELQKKDQAASDGADQKWSPRKKPRQTILTTEAIVPSLRDMALATLAQCVEQIEALGAMDAASRHEIARIVAANRRMTPDVLRLFIFAGVDGVDVPDCSAIDEESFVATVRASTEGEGLKLTVLRLGLCGRCITDCVIEELGNALQTVEILSLRGCYRLSDAGCKLLVRECAPSLREFELSCNQRISKTAIDHLSELKQLSSLTIAECPQLDDAALEALLSMTNLRKLSLDQMEKISDEFVCQLVQKLPHLEEVSLARCSQLTDVAVRTLLESCRELKVLDLSDLDKITDAALEAVRTLRHPLRQIKLRRCLLLTDAAVDHVAFGAQSYLEDLVVSSVPQLTNAAITSLQAHCGATIRALDVSFCRKITEDALGIFTDSAHSLKSLALLGCTQVSARFLQCHSQEDLWHFKQSMLSALYSPRCILSMDLRHDEGAPISPRSAQCENVLREGFSVGRRRSRLPTDEPQGTRRSWSFVAGRDLELALRDGLLETRAMGQAELHCLPICPLPCCPVMLRVYCGLKFFVGAWSRSAESTLKPCHSAVEAEANILQILHERAIDHCIANHMERRFSPYQRKASKRTKSSSVNHAPAETWTLEEDEILRRAVYDYGGKKWKTIATRFDNRRTPLQCNQRWNELQNHGTAVKKPWCSSEDMRMLELVETHGAGKWAVIASYLPGRNGKQCRERWHNQLNPDIKKGPWTPEEDAIIIQEQARHGNKWAKIVEKLPGRTDNAVKNHWHSSMKSKVKRGDCDKGSGSDSDSPPTSASSVTRKRSHGRRTYSQRSKQRQESFVLEDLSDWGESSIDPMESQGMQIATPQPPHPPLEDAIVLMDSSGSPWPSPTHVASSALELTMAMDRCTAFVLDEPVLTDQLRHSASILDSTEFSLSDDASTNNESFPEFRDNVEWNRMSEECAEVALVPRQTFVDELNDMLGIHSGQSDHLEENVTVSLTSMADALLAEELACHHQQQQPVVWMANEAGEAEPLLPSSPECLLPETPQPTLSWTCLPWDDPSQQPTSDTGSIRAEDLQEAVISVPFEEEEVLFKVEEQDNNEQDQLCGSLVSELSIAQVSCSESWVEALPSCSSAADDLFTGDIVC